MATTLNLKPIADVLGSNTESSILGSTGELTGSVGLLAVDLVETANCLELRIGLPAGADESNVNFSLEGNKLMFFAKVPKMGEKGSETPQYAAEHRQVDRSVSGGKEYTNWYREIDLPIPIEVSKLGAAFEHGMLTICIPLTLGIRPENINISQSKDEMPETDEMKGRQGFKGQVRESSKDMGRQVHKSATDVKNKADCVAAGTC